MKKPNLTLYVSERCFFCKKVLDYLDEENLTLPQKDIMSDTTIFHELIDIGGKPQTPCLVINGKPLYESDDIITWVKENKSLI